MLLLLGLGGCECWPDRTPLAPGDRFRGIDPTQATRAFADQNGIIHWLQTPHDAEVRLEVARSDADTTVEVHPCNDTFDFVTPVSVHITSSDGILENTGNVPIHVTSAPKVLAMATSAELPISAVSLSSLLPPAFADEDEDAGSSPGLARSLTLSLEIAVEDTGPRVTAAKLALVGRDRLALAELEFPR